MSARAFTTSFGRVIPVVPDYRRAHVPPRAASVFGGGAGAPPVLGIDGFIKDVYQYALMVEFLESLGLQLRWRTALDVGGAEAAISRLLRGQGLAAHTTTVEIEDFSGALSTRRFLALWLKLRAATAAARRRPALRRCLTDGAPWRGRSLSNHREDFGWVPPASSPFWRLRLRQTPMVDRFEVGDYYALSGPYDLISAVSSLAWFRLDDFFGKASALLTPGGVLYVQADYWWFPVNSTYVVGEFPYAAQRLTPDDFARYVDEFHPEERDDLMRRYGYFHQGERPTVDDYVSVARRAGLELCGVRQLMPPPHAGTGALSTPRFIHHADVAAQAAALADIRCFRPDVRATDLGTGWVQLGFVKR